jgi:uncharacterized membrane protein
MYNMVNMKKRMPFALLLAFWGLTSLQGCYYDKEEELYGLPNIDCSTIEAKFNADIKPLIQTKCAISGCHDASASGGIIFSDYASIQTRAARIRQRAVVERTMPKTGSLTQTEINKLRCWIEGGTPNN